MTKIYIIGHRNINTLEVGLAIQSKDDSITVAPRFTTNIDEVTEYKYFLDKETVNISYKNNAIITITTDDNESNGIIYDDYYNNDIFCMNLAEFNVMPDKLFETDCENDDILVVWVDSSSNVPRADVNEVEYLEDRLSNMNYMYFCNESSDVISDAVLKYVYAEQSEKEEILKDFM